MSSNINLKLHFWNKQLVSYWANQNLKNVLYSNATSRIMLIEFLTHVLNMKKQEHTYIEFFLSIMFRLSCMSVGIKWRIER